MTPVLLRIIAGLGSAILLGLVVFLAFQWGKSDCRADYEKAQRKMAERYAENISDAHASAFKRGKEAAEAAAGNQEQVNAITELAKALEGECMPAELVERLRNIQ